MMYLNLEMVNAFYSLSQTLTLSTLSKWYCSSTAFRGSRPFDEIMFDSSRTKATIPVERLADPHRRPRLLELFKINPVRC